MFFREVNNGDCVQINIDEGRLIVQGEIVVNTSHGITVKLDNKQEFVYFDWEQLDQATEFKILDKTENQHET